MIIDVRDKSTFRPCRIFDGNGVEVQKLTRVDTETGEARQLVVDDDGLTVRERTLEGRWQAMQRDIALQLPIRVEWTAGPSPRQLAPEVDVVFDAVEKIAREAFAKSLADATALLAAEFGRCESPESFAAMGGEGQAVTPLLEAVRAMFASPVALLSAIKSQCWDLAHDPADSLYDAYAYAARQAGKTNTPRRAAVTFHGWVKLGLDNWRRDCLNDEYADRNRRCTRPRCGMTAEGRGR